jgi:hypothetical protein
VTPVVLHCSLCPPSADGLILTIADRAYAAAVDHALDEHRLDLLADPDAALAAITVRSHCSAVETVRRAAVATV